MKEEKPIDVTNGTASSPRLVTTPSVRCLFNTPSGLAFVPLLQGQGNKGPGFFFFFAVCCQHRAKLYYSKGGKWTK